MARVGIFLIVVVLVAGMVGCEPTPIPQYDLTITSTAGGDVIVPGEGTFAYDEGTVVNLVATPDAGYRFVNWTGDVSTIANINAVTTTISMNGDCSITANFVPVRNLAISSTEGGEIVSPGEGIFVYDEGTVVNLVADPDEGYQFASWTGDIGTITDVEDASTTITMNDDCSIVANFALGVLVRDWHDLDAIRDNPGGIYILMNNLDSTTSGYTELASATADEGKGWDAIRGFIGSFDGQGYEIRDLSISRPDETFVGLFGNVVGVVIKNVGVVNITVTGKDHVGGLVGHNAEGTVSNSYCTGSVTGGISIGGLVGYSSNGTVSNCYSTGSVSGDDDVGGLVGVNLAGTVSSSYFTGGVTGEGSVGGLMGGNFGTVSNSYSSANVTGETQVGGLIGNNDCTDYLSPEDGDCVGGIVSECYSNGKVTGSRCGDGLGCVGGLVGSNLVLINNSYSTASVTGYWFVGGLVGCNINGTVSSSYSAGSVTGDHYFGGLVGMRVDDATTSNSFWDRITSGESTSAGGTGEYTPQMHDIDTFSGASWNIIAVADLSTRNTSYIWNIVDGQTYPFLSWQL